MSVLVAVHDPANKCTWLGSDTIGVNGSGTIFNTGPKWVMEDGWAVGMAGSSRTRTILDNAMGKLLGGLMDPFDFTNRLVSDLPSYGYQPSFESEKGPPIYGGQFLLAGPNGLWEIDAALAIFPVAPGHMAAIGSGAEYAAGCAWGLNHTGVAMNPIDAITAFVRCAIDHNADCGGTIWADRVKHGDHDEPNAEQPDDIQARSESVDASGQGQAENEKAAG